MQRIKVNLLHGLHCSTCAEIESNDNLVVSLTYDYYYYHYYYYYYYYYY